mmetsp:Transcript_8449/g.15940  ORF Transcript_8449/g.15940 Transcript_8449/m.15940 type:complete len:576 (-) Transcript_8449:1748-3475(-)|eukprot:CAMPEP_0203754896 /NCGR_PEP_ID=MMETSP0098-20131031/8427_1 /ASSEMBLY_ACC=CAM_ASM_000208 /TAXON_ID=96639 /ORGANISM=" , Strain NY0313808BC1" /LENGTH=575 /DNA_ID=CAMNT_0050646131 /DNA_START=107 /DNA_END=1834 /DNA_ORIENTATION=+
MASRDRVADAEDCKAKGNECLKAQDFDKAIEWYTEAIKLHPGNVYYSNRSAAYLSKGFADSALKDAEECIKLKPDWGKGYSRKGAALHKLGKLDDAKAAFEEGLKIDPNNAGLKSGLEAVEQAKSGAGAAGGMGGMFGPDFMDKIKASPKLSKYLSDPTYMQMITLIQQNPQMLQFAAQDPRIQETFSEILGVSFGTPGPSPEELKKQQEEEREREKKAKIEAEEKEKARLEEEERIKRENETPEEREKREKQEKSIELKEKANAHYKKREFDEAKKYYTQAFELDPENMTFLLNLSAVYLEEGDLDTCLEKCKEALKVGKSVYAPYEQVAKAYVRMGNACFKFKKYKEAIEYYNQAQLEHGTQAVKDKIKKTEKILKKEEAKAYINPEEAAKAKEEGNVKFKAGDFPGSIQLYSEAVRRDPENAVYYGNRSAAYMKLADFGRAMDDCKKALELDPKYTKMYARKGNIEYFLKEYHKALSTYQQGLDIDPENVECSQGLAKTRYAVQNSAGTNDQERAARAMEDPEIRNIMNDPVIRQVLQDMSTNPAAAQKHMADPGIAKKIETLIAAGVLQTR